MSSWWLRRKSPSDVPKPLTNYDSLFIADGSGDTVAGNLYRKDSMGGVFPITGGNFGGGNFNRSVVSVSTSSLMPSTSENLLVTLAKSYRLYTIQTSKTARVRVYGSALQRANDASRPVGTDPGDGAGLMLEYVTTGTQLFTLSPLVDGFDAEASPTGIIPITVTNLSLTQGTVQVSFTFMATE